MELLEASETNIGLVLTNRLSPLAIRPQTLMMPYNKIMQEILKQGKVDITFLALKYGPNIINAALDAAKRLNGLGEMADWPRILEESYAMYEAGIALERESKKLQAGEPIDWTKIQSLSRNAQQSLSDTLMKLSDIQPGELEFIPTGWKAFDEHVGGLPEVGLTVVGGRPGVGKTWFMVQMTTKFVKEHKDRNIAVFSLEMIFKEIATRYKGANIRSDIKPTKEEQERMYICEKPMTAEEIIQTCTTIPNLGLVCIDFADLMIKGEANEGSMAILYKTLALGAKELGCPIILLSQLSRKQGIPKPSDLRYTGLAEALGWMVLMLYDPSTDWTTEDEDEELPILDGYAYIIVWKVRGGFRKHEKDSPGAIAIKFKGMWGWHGSECRWFTLKKYER